MTNFQKNVNISSIIDQIRWNFQSKQLSKWQIGYTNLSIFWPVPGGAEVLHFEGFEVFSFFIVAHELVIQMLALYFANNFNDMVDVFWKLCHI